MQIDHQKIVAVYDKVRMLREHMAQLCPRPQGPVLRIMDLHWAVQDMYELAITMKEVSFQAVHLKGKVERYEGMRARVLVRANLSETEKRSVAVKELCHLVIDEKEDWSPIGTDTINEVLLDQSLFAANGVGQHDPSRPLQSEALAIMAATELMYSGDFQEIDARRLAADQTTISAIALQHEVPAYIIQHALQNRPLRDQAHADLAMQLAGVS